jgi:hypothetical protein
MSAQQVKARFPKRIDLILNHLAAKLAKLPSEKPNILSQRPKTAVKPNQEIKNNSEHKFKPKAKPPASSLGAPKERMMRFITEC